MTYRKTFRPATDQELRAMRDAVYPATPKNVQTDLGWELVKPKWRADEEWLTNEYFKLKGIKP